MGYGLQFVQSWRENVLIRVLLAWFCLARLCEKLSLSTKELLISLITWKIALRSELAVASHIVKSRERMKLSDFLLRVVLLVSSFASSSAYDIIQSIVIGDNSNDTNAHQLSVTYEDYVSCLWAIRTHFAGENPTPVSSYVKDDSRIFSNAVYRRDDIVSTLFAIEMEIKQGWNISIKRPPLCRMDKLSRAEFHFQRLLWHYNKSRHWWKN